MYICVQFGAKCSALIRKTMCMYLLNQQKQKNGVMF